MATINFASLSFFRDARQHSIYHFLDGQVSGINHNCIIGRFEWRQTSGTVIGISAIHFFLNTFQRLVGSVLEFLKPSQCPGC